MTFSFKQKAMMFFVFLIAFNLYIFLAKLLPSDLSFYESNPVILPQTSVNFLLLTGILMGAVNARQVIKVITQRCL